jgi:hypothetical protein
MASIADRIGQASVDLERRGRLAGFLQQARCLVVGGLDGFAVQDEARRSRVLPPVVEALSSPFIKATVAAATTTDSTWASPLAGTQLADAFGELLRDVSAFDRLLPDMVRIPPATKVAAITAGISGAVVGEGAPKPAGKLSAVQFEVTMKKSVAFIVISRELMRMSTPGALALLRRELTGAVAAVTDTTFIDDLTSGISTIASAGGTAVQVRYDMRLALDSVDTGSASKLYWLAGSTVAKRLSVIGDSAGGAAFPETAEGRLGAWPLVISDGVGSGLLVLCDASQIAAAALPVELDASDQTSIEMSDTPNSPPTASTNLVSLWQMNQAALRCTRYHGIKRLRDTAVAVISGVTGVGNSPS